MKILLYSSPTYTDANAVGAWLQAVASQSGGELVTVTLHGGASAAAREIIERSPDSGMSTEEWPYGNRPHPAEMIGVDEVIYLWRHPDRDAGFVDHVRNLGIPLLELGDSLLSERGV